MELQPEWLDKAEKEYKSGQPFGLETFKRNAYKAGATEMLKAVEDLVNKKIEQNESDYAYDEISGAQKISKEFLLQDLLTELKNIKPNV